VRLCVDLGLVSYFGVEEISEEDFELESGPEAEKNEKVRALEEEKDR
jgi:hypothetical protein